MKKTILAVLISVFSVASVQNKVLADSPVMVGDSQFDVDFAGRCSKYFTGKQQTKRITKKLKCPVNILFDPNFLNQESNAIGVLELSLIIEKINQSGTVRERVFNGSIGGNGYTTIHLVLNKTKRKEFYKATIQAVAYPPPRGIGDEENIKTCPEIESPVCAVLDNGYLKTYDNECMAEAESAKILYAGHCLLENIGCYKIYKPVCALSAANFYRVYSNDCVATTNEATDIHDLKDSLHCVDMY